MTEAVLPWLHDGARSRLSVRSAEPAAKRSGKRATDAPLQLTRQPDPRPWLPLSTPSRNPGDCHPWRRRHAEPRPHQRRARRAYHAALQPECCGRPEPCWRRGQLGGRLPRPCVCWDCPCSMQATVRVYSRCDARAGRCGHGRCHPGRCRGRCFAHSQPVQAARAVMQTASMC